MLDVTEIYKAQFGLVTQSKSGAQQDSAAD
jgi:hypothetical protein